MMLEHEPVWNMKTITNEDLHNVDIKVGNVCGRPYSLFPPWSLTAGTTSCDAMSGHYGHSSLAGTFAELASQDRPHPTAGAVVSSGCFTVVQVAILLIGDRPWAAIALALHVLLIKSATLTSSHQIYGHPTAPI